mgnify:CR=1 FL=1
MWMRLILLVGLVANLCSWGVAQQPVNGPLSRELNALSEQYAKRLPPAVWQVMETGIAEVGQSDVMQQAKRTGDAAPDFMLPSAQGPYVRLSERLAQGPVVLVWYRGGWCPYCNRQLAAWQGMLHELNVAGGQLLALCPDLPDSTMSTAERQGLAFPVLSDTGSVVARSYGLVYTMPEAVAQLYKGMNLPAYTGHNRMELPLSATYLIDSQGVIRYAHVEADYRQRAEPDEVIRQLRQLLKTK